MMAGKKYWDVMYTLRPSTSLQMPNIELHRPGIKPGPRTPKWGQKSLGPLKMSLDMAHKVIVPQKKLCPAVS